MGFDRRFNFRKIQFWENSIKLTKEVREWWWKDCRSVGGLAVDSLINPKSFHTSSQPFREKSSIKSSWLWCRHTHSTLRIYPASLLMKIHQSYRVFLKTKLSVDIVLYKKQKMHLTWLEVYSPTFDCICYLKQTHKHFPGWTQNPLATALNADLYTLFHCITVRQTANLSHCACGFHTCRPHDALHTGLYLQLIK